MKTRNQLEDGYPKLLRIEPVKENKQEHHLSQEKLQNASGQPMNLHGMSAQTGNGYGHAAPTPPDAARQYGTSKGFVHYNYSQKQTAAYPARNSNTGSGSNFYLGGRTSSYGPLGCSAIQKQYSFGSSSASTNASGSTNVLRHEVK